MLGRISLRRSSSLVVAVVAALSIVVSASLVLLSSYLHRAAEALEATVESVRLAEEAEVDLLLHARATDAATRERALSDLWHRLEGVRGFIDTPAEVAAYEEVRASMLRYQQDGDFSGAYDAIERFLALNVAQARAAQDRARRWDAYGMAIGIGAGLSLLAILGFITWSLRAHVLRPFLELARTIGRFAEDRSARAPEDAPVEIQVMARQFNEMAATIASQRQAQMAFLAGVAHDLRNPLNALRLSVSVARADAPPEGRLRRTIDLVDRQVSRMDRMVSDFLDVARIEAGELNLQLERADARDIVRSVAELFASVSPKHRLVVSVPAEEVPLLCDPQRIEQVLGNLISNAVKYSPAGGDVGVTLERTGHSAHLAVTDQGVGIDAAEVPRLFEAFRRGGTSAQTHAIAGAGLGLFVVRRIVEAHAGTIDVDSAPGSGSTFRVRLPLLRSATVSASMSARADS